MNIEEVLNEWKNDCEVDRNRLGDEQCHTSNLHQKYLSMLTRERVVFIKANQEFKIIKSDRISWFLGELDEDTIKKYQWGINPKRISRQEISRYIDADVILNKMQTSLLYKQEVISALEKILDHLQKRGYNIKSAIDWYKFQNGG